MVKHDMLEMAARMVWTFSAGAFYWAGWYLGLDELREVGTLIIGAVWIRRPGDARPVHEHPRQHITLPPKGRP